MTVSKINWVQLASIGEPGRYEYPFGWLTVTQDDLDVLRRFPKAVFSLTSSPDGQEHHLGTFEMNEDLMHRVRAVQSFLPDEHTFNSEATLARPPQEE